MVQQTAATQDYSKDTKLLTETPISTLTNDSLHVIHIRPTDNHARAMYISPPPHLLLTCMTYSHATLADC